MTKQKSLLITSLSLIAIAMIGGTSAYFASVERTRNLITTSGVSIELLETSVDDSGRAVPFKDIEDALPGKTYSKIPTVKNIDDGTAWIRICPLLSATDSSGSPLPTPTDTIQANFNTADWTKSNECYYYNNTLAANETTPPLFTEVTISDTLPDIYRNATFSLKLDAEAVQTANNGTDALSAGGWDD